MVEIRALTLSDIVGEIDRLIADLSVSPTRSDVLDRCVDDVRNLLRDTHQWASALSVMDGEQTYIATFQDALWWGDAMIGRITGPDTEDTHRLRIICQILEELRTAAVMLRRDLAGR